MSYSANPYTNQSNLLGKVSTNQLIQMTDDNNTGSLDAAVLNQAILSASTTVDGWLAPGYQGFGANPPAIVIEATNALTLFNLARRRLTPEERNPYASEAKMWEETLRKIGQERGALDANTQSTFPPGIVQTFCIGVNSSTA